MKRTIIHYGTSAFGLLVLGTGLYLIKTIVDPQGVMRALPYVSIGLGCGFFGHGIGEIISGIAVKNHPDIEKQIRINKLDERSVAISNRAKAKAYDVMVFIFGALMITFALMGIDMAAVLLLVISYLFIVGYCIYYRCKFDKEM